MVGRTRPMATPTMAMPTPEGEAEDGVAFDALVIEGPVHRFGEVACDSQSKSHRTREQGATAIMHEALEEAAFNLDRNAGPVVDNC